MQARRDENANVDFEGFRDSIALFKQNHCTWVQ
jgi:hypothetical protein